MNTWFEIVARLFLWLGKHNVLSDRKDVEVIVRFRTVAEKYDARAALIRDWMDEVPPVASAPYHSDWQIHGLRVRFEAAEDLHDMISGVEQSRKPR